MNTLQQLLRKIDGKGYKAYKELQGHYTYKGYELRFDYVQGDPFASPSKLRVIIPNKSVYIMPEWKQTQSRKIYTEDFIARSVSQAIARDKTFIKGTGKSGMIMVDTPGQELIERTAVTLHKEEMVLCLSIGLPANGRRINGKEAEKLLFHVIPNVLTHSVLSLNDHEIQRTCELADQHDTIRAKMKEENWVAFVADGSILPRESGISDRPLQQAVPFQSPEENRVSISIPHQEQPITGMALKKGITLIVGGGYHGKSTLLKAIERGVYPHIRGDGREFVLTDLNAMKVRAEDGRAVTTVNISPFINDLPHKEDTTQFSTDNASGSTSQAANVMEAIEAGASTILMDEDTSATNFMIRDERMQSLVTKEKEPITPFIDQVKPMKDELDVSTILVMGGSGDYFDVADEVILLDQYEPFNVTNKAKKIAAAHPQKRRKEVVVPFHSFPNRHFQSSSIQSYKGKKSKVQAKGLHHIVIGQQDLSLHLVEQMVHSAQTNTIAMVLQYMERKGLLKKRQSLPDLLDRLEKQMDEQGMASFAPYPEQHPGELARPRRFEIAAALNRLRTANVTLL
ncbi:ABC-ATPase domain-containing protein [Pontibacillus litoralis]|uniref:ABC transporter ATPase n=1 Tax=Pontibacillus litoralis JSM 072002 TaxID=1385512 RepID=A0A0A5G5I0_9BACI|nr:ABC transporter ATPase [Pontibacillus litoralis JSM 072002]